MQTVALELALMAASTWADRLSGLLREQSPCERSSGNRVKSTSWKKAMGGSAPLQDAARSTTRMQRERREAS